MASTYFGDFPLMTYTLDPKATSADDVVTNIFRRVAFTELLLRNASSFYPYQIKESDTPESIAHKYYSDSRYFWLVTLVNNIIDPVLDWPLNYQDFKAMIETKYGSLANAQQQSGTYLLELNTVNSNTEVARALTIIDQYAFDSRGLQVVPYVDTFTRTTVGNDYQTLPGHNINLTDPIAGFVVANNALSTVGSGAALLSHDMPVDQYINATIGPVANATGIITLGVRAGITHDKLSGYFADISCNGANVVIYKYEEFDWVAQTGKTILTEYNFAANATTAIANNMQYRVAAFGDVITLHKNGNLMIHAIDTSSLITGTKGMVGLKTKTSITTLEVGPDGMLGRQEDFQRGMIGQNPEDHQKTQSPTTDFRYWNDNSHILNGPASGIFVSGSGSTPLVTIHSGGSYGFVTANTPMPDTEDHSITVTVGRMITANPAFIQVAVRGTADNVADLWTGYDYQITSNGSFSLQRCVSANATNGGNVYVFSGNNSPLGQIADGDKLTVTAQNTAISYYRNGVLEATYDDPAPLSGVTCGFGLRHGVGGAVTLNYHLTNVTITPILANSVYQFPVYTNTLVPQATELAGRVYSFPDATTVTTTVNTGSLSAYDVEVLKNDKKRQIKLLKKDYLLRARAELARLTGNEV